MYLNSYLQSLDVVFNYSTLALESISQLQNCIERISKLATEIQNEIPNDSCQKLSSFKEKFSNSQTEKQTKADFSSAEKRSKMYFNQGPMQTVLLKQCVDQYPFMTSLISKKRLSSDPEIANSRVFKTDSLLKKIKAKYLKFLYLCLREILSEKLDLVLPKFSQVNEVRNIDIFYNQRVLNMTVLEYVTSCGILNSEIHQQISNEPSMREFFDMKVKDHYYFFFLKSPIFRKWVEDPVKLYEIFRGHRNYKPLAENKNCQKFSNYSKNLFVKEDYYKEYKSELFKLCLNYVFYFQNNSYFN